MSMTITDEQVRTIVAKSILEALTPEARTEMLQKAIVSILELKPISNSYYGGSKQSKLEEIFQMEAHALVREIVREELKKEEMQGKIRAAVTGALTKAFAMENLEAALAGGIVQAFTVRLT